MNKVELSGNIVGNTATKSFTFTVRVLKPKSP